MEWIKSMSLRKALFALAFMDLLIATLLSAAAFWGCMKLNTALVPSAEQIIIGADTAARIEMPEPVTGGLITENTLTLLQFGLPMLFYIAALVLTASLFYRLKLKQPLSVLMDGAQHMMGHDLDFSISTESNDELGQLCTAFETMRQSLLESSRELWRQAEERKRLNAAFSHDLRNPITVLKGSSKLAVQCADSGNIPQLMENLNRIEAYTARMERYVETMSRVQHLEQLEPRKSRISAAKLNTDMKKALDFAAAESGKKLDYYGLSDEIELMLDQEMLFQITENLAANALRFAKQSVSVRFSIEGENLKLMIADDGCGFSAELLKSGIRPFGKGTEEAGHFGMGLYICDLLCRKHGGCLKIANNATGAVVCACLKIS